MSPSLLRTAAARLSVALCVILLTACATPRPAAPGQAFWSGRMAVQVDSTPPQSFSSGFELSGQPEAGELVLTSPLGNAVGVVHWTPGLAEWRQGPQITRRSSLAELSAELAGTPLPVAALFAWLRGQPAEADGWQADLSQQREGRITARRLTPLPPAELRIVFEP